eukprot:762036-Hanusia_phi.AAC.5
MPPTRQKIPRPGLPKSPGLGLRSSRVDLAVEYHGPHPKEDAAVTQNICMKYPLLSMILLENKEGTVLV